MTHAIGGLLTPDEEYDFYLQDRAAQIRRGEDPGPLEPPPDADPITLMIRAAVRWIKGRLGRRI